MPAFIVNLENWLISIIIFAAFLLLSLLSKFFLQHIVPVFTKKTKTILDDLIVKALVTPVVSGLLIAGIWLGISNTKEFADYLPVIHKIFSSVIIIVIALFIIRLINAILTWYGKEIASRTKSDKDDKLIPLLRRVVTFVGAALALLFILQVFGIEIGPLLTALGIGGLAVALALQPTLTDFIAGTYVMSDADVRLGDYILLDNGVEGTVEEIGWRTTRIRHWQGNLIILPNSKLSESVITDYEKPDKAMAFTLDCGVSYESDLEKVERVTIEVAKQVLASHPEGDKCYEPAVRFKEFGDSNINFYILLKSVTRGGRFALRHAFIKALNKRYQEEGIEIQYPVRKLQFSNELNTKEVDKPE